MFHWDTASGILYKSPGPYILKGGYDNFAMSYPTLVTNPWNRSRPPTASKKSIDIENVQYPDLDTAFIASPHSQDISGPAPNNGTPGSPAVVSGAISVSNPEMEAMASPSRPKIPDRKTKPIPEIAKPHLPEKTREPDRNSTASVASEFDKALVIDSSSESISIPVIDRSLKAKALMKSNLPLNNQHEVLEAEKDIIEDSLRLENEELKVEEEWEKLRLKKENAASEELRLQVMQREEELVEKLQKISLEKDAKDRENKELLERLEAMKAKLEARDEDWRIQDEIIRKKAEKEKRKSDVEKLRRERVKKQQIEEMRQIELKNQQKRVEEARRKREETEKAIHEKITKVPLKKVDGGSEGGLNRSHSSPNIAKMLEDEEGGAHGIIPTPKFDRNIKPEVKNRNFAAIWGTSKKGLTGLRNLGNTCYMNSLLQCLSNFTLPSQYFIGEQFKNDLNRNSETNGEIAVEFAEVIRMLWSGQYKSIATYDFKRTVGKHCEMFRGTDQQDAHELLLILMEFLHQDVNLVRCKVKIPEQNNENMPEIEAAKRAWDMEKKADQSFLRETFYGQQRSTLTCPHCGWKSVTYESFFELPLKLPAGNRRCSLMQLIETYLSQDEVPYKCPTCKKERQCLKQFEIVKLPLILTISLGRFYNDGLSRKKQNFVDFGLTDINLGQFATGCHGRLNKYRDYTLYGISNHFGSLESGHYTAFCYSQVYKKWYKYDDTEVYEMDATDVKSPAAYILFYSAKN